MDVQSIMCPISVCISSVAHPHHSRHSSNCEPQGSNQNMCIEERAAKPLNPPLKRCSLDWIENEGDDEAEADFVDSIREELSVEELDNSFEIGSSEDDEK